MPSAKEMLARKTGDEERWGLSQYSDEKDDLDISLVTLPMTVVSTKQKIDIAKKVLDGEINETIEGASTVTLTLHDPEGELTDSGIFGVERKDGRIDMRACDIRVNKYWFRLAALSRGETDLTLTFEDRNVKYMRGKKGPKKAARSKVTRAEFIYALIREISKVRIPFYCPELHIKQPIGKQSQAEAKEVKDRERKKGLDPDASLKVFYLPNTHKDTNADQLKLGEKALDVADSQSAGQRATLALMAALMIEGSMENPKGGDDTSVGPLQLLDTHYGGNVSKRRDLARVVSDFLNTGFTGRGGAIKLAKDHPGWTVGQIAQAVQGSAHPERYDLAAKDAKAWIEAYQGGGGLGAKRYKKYEFKIDKEDNYWTGAQKLAEEVKWRLFSVRGWFYFIAEEDLLASQPRYVVSRSTPGVQSITWNNDDSKPVNEGVITANIRRFGVPPGTVLRVTGEGNGNGRWIVSGIRRGIFSTVGTITIKRLTPSEPEPRPELAAESSDSDNTGGEGSVGRFMEVAERITKKHYAYVWGGGHSNTDIDHPSGGGYDCSGGICANLKEAGMAPSSWGKGAVTSGVIADSYGEPGEGKTLTIWANKGHVFAIAVVNGKKVHIGTGRWGGQGGYEIQDRLHPTAGYTPRHWKGT